MFSTSHLHPMLIHFPIALVAIGFLAECISLIVKKNVPFKNEFLPIDCRYIFRRLYLVVGCFIYF